MLTHHKLCLSSSLAMLMLFSYALAHAESNSQSQFDNQVQAQLADATNRIAALEIAQNTPKQSTIPLGSDEIAKLNTPVANTTAQRTANGHGR